MWINKSHAQKHFQTNRPLFKIQEMMAYLQGKSQLIGGCKRGSREGPENLNGCDVLIDCRTTIRVLTGRASQTTVDASSRGFCIPSNGGQTHLFPQRQQNELFFLFFF